MESSENDEATSKSKTGESDFLDDTTSLASATSSTMTSSADGDKHLYKSCSEKDIRSTSIAQKEKAKKIFSVFQNSSRSLIHKQHRSRSAVSSPAHGSSPILLPKKGSSTAGHYKSYDNITDHNNKTSSPPHNNLPLAPIYPGDVWSEIGSDGGVCRLPGYDVSLHVETRNLDGDDQVNLKTICSDCHPTGSAPKEGNQRQLERNLTSSFNKKRARPFSKSAGVYQHEAIGRLRDFDCPCMRQQDGRVVLRLEDPPDASYLESNKIITCNGIDDSSGNACDEMRYESAGPMLYLSFALRLLSIEKVTLQLTSNVLLQPPGDDMRGRIVCLQSSRRSGPFKLIEKCLSFGDIFQLTLDSPKLKLSGPALRTGKLQDFYILPVIEYDNSAPSSWYFIGRRNYHVGIYGPEMMGWKNVCCVYISGYGFCPPDIKIENENKRSHRLFLWNSYLLSLASLQDLTITVTCGKGMRVDGGSGIVSKQELGNISKPHKLFFTLAQDILLTNHQSTNCEMNVTMETMNQHVSYQISLSTHQYISTYRQLNSEQKKKNRTRTVLRLWKVCQRQSRLRLLSPVDKSKEELCPIEVAVCMAPLKRVDCNDVYMLKCQANEYLPILSKKTIERSGGKRPDKSWAIAYHCHQAGLVELQSVRYIPYEKCSEWPEINVTREKIIEAVALPLKRFSYSFTSMRDKLTKRNISWPLFARIVNYGEVFAQKAIIGISDSGERDINLFFYIQKFKNFCDQTPGHRLFHREVIKALLYLEEYDLAEELTLDLALASVARNFEHKKKQILSKLLHKTNEKLPVKSPVKENEDFSAVSFSRRLMLWTKQFKKDRQTLMLILDKVIDDVSQGTNDEWPHFVAAVILILSIDIMRSCLTKL